MKETAFTQQEDRAARQLGRAMYEAIALTVRRYMGAPDEIYEGTDSVDAAALDETQTLRFDGGENAGFDLERFFHLREEETVRTEESMREEAARGETQPESRLRRGGRRVRETEELTERSETEAPARGGETEERMSGSERTHTEFPSAAARTEEKTLWERRGAEEGEGARSSAQELSDRIERETRRYDGGFYLY